MISLNGVIVTPTIFPDHTSQVWKLDPSLLKTVNNVIEWEFVQESDLILICQLNQLVRFSTPEPRNVELRIKYLPYGRQDKSISNDATFGLKTFAAILNSFMWSKVVIMDPHSEIAIQIIHFAEAIYPAKLLETIAQSLEGNIVLCYPDKGAVKKYTKVYETLYRPYIYGEKVRDQLTGNITSYEVFGDPAGKNVLIVDDICDGGMTFKILAKDLLAKGAKEVNLFVTHGIFSRGLKTLKDSGINRIFAQDGEASEVQNQIVYRNIIK